MGKRDLATAKIRGVRGLAVRVADACGIKPQAVRQWEKVPVNRVIEVSKVIGMKPSEIRPDLHAFFKRAGR